MRGKVGMMGEAGVREVRDGGQGKSHGPELNTLGISSVYSCLPRLGSQISTFVGLELQEVYKKKSRNSSPDC